MKAKVEASAAIRSSFATAFRVSVFVPRLQVVGNLLEKSLDLADGLVHVRVNPDEVMSSHFTEKVQGER